jgi:NitT/TauT family transport system substrate-binding protein
VKALPRRQRGVRIGTIGALTGLVLLSACAAPAATDKSAAAHVRFIQANRTLSGLPLLQALGAHYFATSGLAIQELPDATSSTAPIQAMLAGQADIVMVGSNAALAAQQAGQDVVGIGILASRPTLQMVLRTATVSRLAATGVTPTAPVERKVAALRGLTIATTGPGNIIDQLLRATLRQFGLNPDRDVTIRTIPDANAMLAAVREEQVDGFIFALPPSQQPTVDGTGALWLDFVGGEVPAFASMPANEIVTTRRFAADQPDAVRGFMAAISRGFDDVAQRPEQVRAAVRATPAFARTAADLFDKSFDAVLPAFKAGPKPSPAGYQTLLGVYNADPGQAKVTATYEQHYDLSFLGGGGS